VTWLNPWALLGLATVIAPVLIHLLARGHARTRRFPSLRFLQQSQLLPTRRTRIHEPLLLAVRCAIVALAVLALAQPLLLTAGRTREIDRGLARAIVLDTSASMRRSLPTLAGSSALDSARRVARALAGEATASIVIETSEPARALEGAVAWLGQRYQRADVAVISDFQRGQLDANDVRAIPADVSVTLHRVPVAGASPIETQWTSGSRRVAVRAVPRGQSMDAEWMVTSESRGDSTVALLGAESDRAAMTATRIAAATAAVPTPKDSTRAITIVFPGYSAARLPGSSADSLNRRLDTNEESAHAAWMVDLLARVNAQGNDVRRSAVAGYGSRRQLVLFTDSAPGSLASARIVAAANRALSAAPPLAELEPETLSDRELESLQRTTRTGTLSRSTDPNGESDARWLWLAAGLLLLIELPLRRERSRAVASVAAERARAA
jgi:Aerotolerance regulator N-terminal